MKRALTYLTVFLAIAGISFAAAGGSASVSQSASVSGGNAYVEQESTVTTQSGDNVVRQHAEKRVRKQAGQPAQVYRDVNRSVNGSNESVYYNVDQRTTEGNRSVTSTQQVRQGVRSGQNRQVTDQFGAPVGNASADSQMNSRQQMEAQDMQQPQSASASAETRENIDGTAYTGQATQEETTPLEQGGSFALTMDAVVTVQDALADLFGL